LAPEIEDAMNKHRGRRFESLTGARVAGLVIALIAAVSFRAGVDAQVERSAPSLPDRASAMRYHFLDVSAIHEAVIRGDLTGAREAAQTLTIMPVPRDTLADGVPFVMAITTMAARVREARDLTEAAGATALMLRQCAECHQALRVRPTPAVVQRPDLGGIVGHMLEHQRAVDALLRGLIIPSAAEWREGAERLKGAPLHPSYLLPDPNWTRFRRQADERVHQIAERAQRASNPILRGAVYADLLTTCADCHSLHNKLWGPGRGN
jgi:hypothetical protein